MQRSLTLETMDDPNAPEALLTSFHRDLKLIHTLIGDMRAITKRVKSIQPRTIIDIGCGDGALLDELKRATGASVTGVELRPPAESPYHIPIVQADATRDPLPLADVAVSMMVLHHLDEERIVGLIRNVGRYCKKFVCLDLVRHPLPMALFTAFVCPFIGKIAAQDGRQSIRRSFTGPELRALAERAVEGSGAFVQHDVSRAYAGQILEITYRD